MNQKPFYELVAESSFNNQGQKVYLLNNGTSIIQDPKYLTRQEAEKMLDHFINNLGSVNVSYHFSKGLIFTQQETNKEIPLKSMELTLDRFDRLRNYEIEERFLKYFGETYLICEPCPFNGFLSYPTK